MIIQIGNDSKIITCRYDPWDNQIVVGSSDGWITIVSDKCILYIYNSSLNK